MIPNFYSIKIPYSFRPHDQSLTISVAPEHEDILYEAGYNVACDLTLCRSQHLDGRRGQRVIDLPLRKQRKFFTDKIYQIINRYNGSFGECEDKIEKAIVVFEVQPKTGHCHVHSNFKITCGTNSTFALVKLKDIVKSIGFNPMGVYIEYIKDPLARKVYLYKQETKYPSYLLHFYHLGEATDCIIENRGAPEACASREASEPDIDFICSIV